MEGHMDQQTKQKAFIFIVYERMNIIKLSRTDFTYLILYSNGITSSTKAFSIDNLSCIVCATCVMTNFSYNTKSTSKRIK